MRILLVNPNTTASVTEQAAAHVRRLIPAEIVAVTGRFGAHYISTGPRRRSPPTPPSTPWPSTEPAATRSTSPASAIPVSSPSRRSRPSRSSAWRRGAAPRLHPRRRVGIVTGGVLWRPMLEEFAASLGLSSRLSGIRAIAPTGGEIARDPDAALARLAAACRACAEEDGADVVILGGAALAGLADRVQPDVPVPVICSTEAGPAP